MKWSVHVLLIALATARAALLGGLFGAAKSGLSDGLVKGLKPLDKTIDPLSCMGTWYVQRQVPALAILEAGARNGVERYSYDPENERIDVRYTFNRRDAPDDAVTTVRQRGWVKSDRGCSYPCLSAAARSAHAWLRSSHGPGRRRGHPVERRALAWQVLCARAPPVCHPGCRIKIQHAAESSEHQALACH